MYKNDRERKELESLLNDPKYVGKAWQSIGQLIANRPATILPTIVDKDGNETLSSMINSYTYSSLKRDLDVLNSDSKEPTELEMILASQMVKARYDTAAAVFVRDTIGAKPVDESKLESTNVNVFEGLTDEELDILAKHREAKREAEEAERATAIVEKMTKPVIEDSAGYGDK